MRFAGKTIVVTGSGREKGLGQGILQRFADEGANCVVSDRMITPEAKGVAAELRARGAEVAEIACDVADVAQCRTLMDQTVAMFGGIDIHTQGTTHHYAPLEPWFEAGPDPVYAAAAKYEASAFARVSFLPASARVISC